jgi:hypothetical protein
VDYASPILLESLHGPTASVGVDTYALSPTTGDHTHFTRIDKNLNFTRGRTSMLSELIPSSVATYPTSYFSVKWKGFLKANQTALYRIYLETEESVYHQVYLNQSSVIHRRFRIEGEVDNSSTTDIAGETYVDFWLEANVLVPFEIRYA